MPGFDPQTVRWLLPLVLLGHLSLWVGIFNRLHALNIPDHRIRQLERFLVFPLAAVIPPILVALSWNLEHLASPPRALLAAYHGLALASLTMAAVIWCQREWYRSQDQRPLRGNHTVVRNWAERRRSYVAEGAMQRMAQIPGNQILELHVHHKRLVVPRLPASLSGLTIAHLSDLHITGRFSLEFYQAIVQESNGWNPDLVVVTGDIVDKARCLDWIHPTLGRLESRLGSFYILGNHDLRVGDEAALRRALHESGMTDVGSQCHLTEWNKTPVLLAGDERPWFGCGPDPGEMPPDGFRILLAHSPDRFPWAVSQDFDLVLAGHTHGGQIRLPAVGPIVCPSAYGVRYASGVFCKQDTVMHVTRGLCGVHPLRFGCPPELAILTLETPSDGKKGRNHTLDSRRHV